MATKKFTFKKEKPPTGLASVGYTPVTFIKLNGKIGHTTTTTGGVWSEWNHNGVDRIDPTCGYVLSNCQPACWRCNRMKANLSEEKFLTKIRLIYEHKLHQS